MKNLNKHILAIIFFLSIPYMMESAFYWLPLTTDHLSDTYTTFCVGLFGLWVNLVHTEKKYTNNLFRYSIFYMIILYFVWTAATLIENTTLGFNKVEISSILVYSVAFLITYAFIKTKEYVMAYKKKKKKK